MVDRQTRSTLIIRQAHGPRSVAVERRAIAPRPDARPCRTPAEIRAIGVAAVEAALFPTPLADDVARILAGRTTFLPSMYGTAL